MVEATSIEQRQQEATRLDYLQVLKNRHPIIILVLLLVLITATLISFVWPPKYEASATVQINQMTTPIAAGEGASAMAGVQNFSANFFATQVEVMTSPETLRKVVEELDLAGVDKWNTDPEAAIRRIGDSVETRPTLGTDLVRITYRDGEPEVAEAIVQEIIRAYETRRVDTEMMKMESGLSSLADQIDHLEDQVTSNQAEMVELAHNLDIIVSPGGYGVNAMIAGTPTIDQDPLYYWHNEVLRLESEVASLRASVERLQELEGDQLIEMARRLNLEDVTIARLWPLYQDLSLADKDMEAMGLGINHPSREAVRAKLGELRGYLLDAAETVKGTLDVQVALAQNRLDSARGEFETAKEAEEKQGPERFIFDQARDTYQRSVVELSRLREQYVNIRAQSEMYRHPIDIQQHPKVSGSTVEPNWTLNLAIGGVLGLALGVGLAFVIELADTTVRSMEEVEAFLGVPVLAVIPKGVGDLTSQSGASPDAEAYRILRTNIEFNRSDDEANVVTLVSGGAGEGKTTTLVNLAYVCAQGGYNTLLIDADLRRPQLHNRFDVENHIGLTNFLTSDLMLEDVVLQTPVDHLFLLPSGILPQDASGLLNSRKMTDLLADVRQRFDLVLVDSPPILGVSDASVIVREVDLTIVVVQHRKLPRKMLLRVQQVIENVGGNLLGVVLNNVDIHSDSQYQYYTSYYTYYSSDMTRANDSRRAPSRTQAGAEKTIEPARDAQAEDLY